MRKTKSRGERAAAGRRVNEWRSEGGRGGAAAEDAGGQQSFTGCFADPEAQCAVFHICQADGRMGSFQCPLGTLFDQEHFICDWWFNVDCRQ